MTETDKPFDWPKTLKVGGREYELHPDMSMRELNEAQDTLQNQAEKIALLHWVIQNGDIPDDFYEVLPFDRDDESMEEYR